MGLKVLHPHGREGTYAGRKWQITEYEVLVAPTTLKYTVMCCVKCAVLRWRNMRIIDVFGESSSKDILLR